MISITKLRRTCLRVLIETVDILIDRFGARLTLGELKAVLVTHLALSTHERITLTDVADASGQPKQSISRWLRRAPHVYLADNPDDARSKILKARDMEAMVAYLDQVIEARMAGMIERRDSVRAIIDGQITLTPAGAETSHEPKGNKA